MGLEAVKAQTSSVGRVSNAQEIAIRGTRDGALFTADWIHALVQEGRVFVSCDADANDVLAGQASTFADTTPTLLLAVPSGTVAIPLLIRMSQVTPLANASFDVNIAVCSTAIAYASGGTAEVVYGARTDKPIANLCTLYSGATATAALLTKQVASWTIANDISPAEGAIPEVLWTPDRYGFPLYLVGPAAIGVFTYVATTAPSWYWTVAWAELPAGAITG